MQGGDWCDRVKPVDRKDEMKNWSCMMRASTALGSSRLDHTSHHGNLTEVMQFTPHAGAESCAPRAHRIKQAVSPQGVSKVSSA